MSETTDRDAEIDDDCQSILDALATANADSADALQRAARLATTDHPVMDLYNTHGALLESYQATRRAIDRIENTVRRVDTDYKSPLPRQVIREHADRLEEQYDGPVLMLALQLLDYNRREWLHQKPETRGAEEVERHGLTANQRESLNQLREAWRAYDEGDTDA